MGGLAQQRPSLTHHRDWGHFVHCLPSGTGSETFFRLRADGYRGDLGNESMGQPGHWRMVWSMTENYEIMLPQLNETKKQLIHT